MLQQHLFKKKGLKKRRRRDDEKIAHKLELNKQVGEIYKKKPRERVENTSKTVRSNHVKLTNIENKME
jgi:hypothetical protein